MDEQALLQLLRQVQAGALPPEQAARAIGPEPFVRLDYATVDTQRKARQGVPEVIYGASKTPEQITGICQTLLQRGERNILITRLSPQAAELVGTFLPLDWLEDLTSARVVIAVAGMEGALASVVGGLVSCPVIAVPTSVGYGASFGGVAALLAMINSCASGVSVVNIDNGFGAGFQASLINRMEGCGE